MPMFLHQNQQFRKHRVVTNTHNMQLSIIKPSYGLLILFLLCIVLVGCSQPKDVSCTGSHGLAHHVPLHTTMVPTDISAVWELSSPSDHDPVTAKASSASSHQHALSFLFTSPGDDTVRNRHPHRPATTVQKPSISIARSLAARSEANVDHWTPGIDTVVESLALIAAAIALYYQWKQTHALQRLTRGKFIFTKLMDDSLVLIKVDHLHVRWVGVMDIEAQQVDDARHEVFNWLDSKLDSTGRTLFDWYATFCDSWAASYGMIRTALFDLSTAFLNGCGAMYR